MEELKATVHAAAKGDLRAFEHLVLHFQDMAGVLGNGEGFTNSPIERGFDEASPAGFVSHLLSGRLCRP